MYNVSANYRNAMSRKANRYRLTGLIGETAFTGDDVVGGSFIVKNQCSDTDIVQIGSVYSAELDCTLRLDMQERRTWEGTSITASEGMEVGTDSETGLPVFEYVPLGVFTVAEANYTEEGVQIVAYDNMLKFDKTFTLTSTIGEPFHIVKMLCDDCGVVFGMTRAQVETLTNGRAVTALYAENDIETYRDALFWIAQFTASYATIGRDGKLYLRQYADGHSVETDDVDAEHRYEGSVFSDFVTEYSGVSFVNTENQEVIYVTDGQADDKLTYNLGANPFLQFGTASTRKQYALNILSALRKIYYVPFSTGFLNSPAYDLGDIIVCEGGLGDGSIGCIMSYEYSFSNGIRVEGFGMNPALSTARNKMDKEIAGLLSKTDKNSLQFYTFKNAQIAVVNNNMTRELIHLRFATKESKQVTFQAEILCETFISADDIKATLTYYLDGVEVTDYHPVETWDEEGKHIISLYYMIDVEPNHLYQWQVYIKSEGGSIFIPTEHARGTIWGQGLVATDKWNGFIDVEDNVGAIQLDSILVATFTDACSVSAQEPISRAIAEDLTVLDITDSINVAQFEDYVLVNKTSLVTEQMTWDDVKMFTWEEIKNAHTW